MRFKRDKKKDKAAGSPPAETKSQERIANKLDHVMVAEDTARPNPLKRLVGRVLPKDSKHRKLKLAAAALVVIVLASSLLVYFTRDTEEPDSILSDQQLKIEDATDARNVAIKYGKDYDDFSKELDDKSYTGWSKDELDKAYFNLLYADKIGLFTQVDNILVRLKGAQMNGVDIDDNSYGIGQAERDAIKERANAEREKLQ